MAYTKDWDDAVPDGATVRANTLDTVIKDLKIATRERMNELLHSSTDWEDNDAEPKKLKYSAIEDPPTIPAAGFSQSGVQGLIDAEEHSWEELAEVNLSSAVAEFNFSNLPTTGTGIFRVDLLYSISGTASQVRCRINDLSTYGDYYLFSGRITGGTDTASQADIWLISSSSNAGFAQSYFAGSHHYSISLSSDLVSSSTGAGGGVYEGSVSATGGITSLNKISMFVIDNRTFQVGTRAKLLQKVW